MLWLPSCDAVRQKKLKEMMQTTVNLIQTLRCMQNYKLFISPTKLSCDSFVFRSFVLYCSLFSSIGMKTHKRFSFFIQRLYYYIHLLPPCQIFTMDLHTTEIKREHLMFMRIFIGQFCIDFFVSLVFCCCQFEEPKSYVFKHKGNFVDDGFA
jgi:hypothetical protein